VKRHFSNSIAVINLNVIQTNLKAIKERVTGKKILAVVKCDAYRHGAIKVSKAIENEVDWLAVAHIDEGIELRMAGIKIPILVLGVPDYETAAAYQTHNLTATVSHETHFSILMDGTTYHLNFDTGMGRLGFRPAQAVLVRNLAIANQRLICSGIYSHYATADDPGSDFVIDQNDRFLTILSHFPEIPLVHMSNTGAVANYADLNHFDMVRIGLGMLGYNAGEIQYRWLEPALIWKTNIVQVRPVEKGDTVSYSSTWTASKNGYLATLPVGYGDGIPRSISNKLNVLINKKLYGQVGNVTMDMTMINLNDDKIAVETEVILLGGDAWNASDWAKQAGTNIHEILTRLGDRITYRYQQEQEV